MTRASKHNRWLACILSVVLVVLAVSIGTAQTARADNWKDVLAGWFDSDDEDAAPALEDIDEDGTYTSKDEVAAYLHLYAHLPQNFITKKEAKALGWVSSEGNLDEVAPGMSIGGDYFGNYEGLLPEDDDRTYRECDIDYEGGWRGAKRIIYSDDGLIYYTEDHYSTFTLLYDEEGAVE